MWFPGPSQSLRLGELPAAPHRSAQDPAPNKAELRWRVWSRAPLMPSAVAPRATRQGRRQDSGRMWLARATPGCPQPSSVLGGMSPVPTSLACWEPARLTSTSPANWQPSEPGATQPRLWPLTSEAGVPGPTVVCPRSPSLQPGEPSCLGGRAQPPHLRAWCTVQKGERSPVPSRTQPSRPGLSAV